MKNILRKTPSKETGSGEAAVAQTLNNGVSKRIISDTMFLLIVTIGLFILMYAAGMFAFSAQGFAKPQMFLNLFITNAGLIVIALGLTIVMITGGIDISVGGVTALVAMASAYLMEQMGASAYVAVLVSLLIGLGFGLLHGVLVAYFGIQPFIVTLAGMFLGRGLTAVISKEMISIKNETFLAWAKYRIELPIGTVNNKGNFIPAYVYPTVIIALLVVVAIVILLKFTKFGRSLYAIGGSNQSALMMGLNVRRTKFFAYVLCGFLSGLGGFLFTLNSCSGFVEQARGFEMDAISSSVIGGTLLSGGVGNPIGTLFGVLIKGTIQQLITTQGTLSSWWVRIAISALLCFFIVLQSIIVSRKRKSK
jgi:simple sugar transport system permease protein